MGKYYKDIISKTVDLRNKDTSAQIHIDLMLNRTSRIFKWEGLPRTIPQRMLELYLQTSGNVFVTEVDGDLYAFFGGLGGVPDAYYQPTIYTVSNSYLKLSKQYEIGVDGVLVRNDTLMTGLMPMINRAAYLLAENEISLWLASVNQRIVSIINADNESTRHAAEEYLNRVLKGDLGVIMGTGLTEALHTQPYSSAGNNSITQLIELEQYLKAGILNDLGLNANYNMKREALSMTESQLNDDALLPFIDDMLEQRKQAVEEINKMYGTKITVDLASAWKLRSEEMNAPEAPEEGEEANEFEIGVPELEN